MWKIILYNKIRFDRLEAILYSMEKKGYRLNRVLFGIIFFFKAKKDYGYCCNYRVHMHYAKMFDWQLDDIEALFSKKCNANPVKSNYDPGLGYISIWRYGKTPDQAFLQEINQIHDRYLLKIVRWQFLGDMFFLLSFGVVMIYAILKERQSLYICLGTIGTIAFLALAAYRVYEWLVLKRRS